MRKSLRVPLQLRKANTDLDPKQEGDDHMCHGTRKGSYVRDLSEIGSWVANVPHPTEGCEDS